MSVCAQMPPQGVKGALPDRVDVVIVGAGVAGVAAAYQLAQSGRSVLVCEKGRIAGEQSSRAFGWICSLGLAPIKMELTQRSKLLWEELARKIGAAKLGYRRCGLMHLCHSEEDLAGEQQWLDSVTAYDVDARILSAAEAAALQPGNTGRYVGALYQASDARVEPELATAALAELASSQGVRIASPCAVRGFETRAGSIEAVVTEHGRIGCEQVVVAGGIWSRLFLGNAGIRLLQLPIHSSLVQISAVAGEGPQSCAAGHQYAFRRDERGGYVIGTPGGHRAQITLDSFRLFFSYLPVLKHEWGKMRVSFGKAFFEDYRRARSWPLDAQSPFEHERILDPVPDVATNLDTLARLAMDFPSLGSAAVERHWAGIIDATPDSLPVVSAIDETPGLFVTTGYSAYGLTMALAGGELLADLMTGRTPRIDGRPYRHSRFTDGSKLRVAI